MGIIALLVTLLCFFACQGLAYSGFDCDLGTALLYLTEHSSCGSTARIGCLRSLAMRVHGCDVHAWPRHPHSMHHPCAGLHLRANVTQRNVARGALSSPTGHLPASLSYGSSGINGSSEGLRLLVGDGCVLRFDAQGVSDAALGPEAPFMPDGSTKRALELLLPAALLAAAAAATVMGVAGAAVRWRRSSAAGGDGSSDTHAALLSGHERSAEGLRLLGIVTSARRARRKRGRAPRPVYVGESGHSGEGTAAAWRVAPSLRFPPVAAVPLLAAIPEVRTPELGSSAAPSRTGSEADITQALCGGP